MEALYRAFGRQLSKARRTAGLTQEELGKRVGLGRTSITNIEAGTQRVPLHVAFQFARATGVSIGDLLPDDSTLGAAVGLENLPQNKRKPVERQIRGLSDNDRNRILRLLNEGALKVAETD